MTKSIESPPKTKDKTPGRKKAKFRFSKQLRQPRPREDVAKRENKGKNTSCLTTRAFIHDVSPPPDAVGSAFFDPGGTEAGGGHVDAKPSQGDGMIGRTSRRPQQLSGAVAGRGDAVPQARRPSLAV